MLDLFGQIEVLLQRKRNIDAMPSGQFTETNRWLVDGVELLLRSIVELREELKQAGILR